MRFSASVAFEVQTTSLSRAPMKPATVGAGLFEDVGGLNGQRVGAAVHGRIEVLVEVLLGLVRRSGLLRGGTRNPGRSAGHR